MSLAGPSDTIWLNARELDIRSASARSGNGGAGGGTLTAAAVEAGTGFLRLSFPRSLSPGAWTVVITYTGRLTDRDSKGLFRQKDAGEWYAFSQFEAIDARRAFPCFDEPSFKTPWQLTLHVRKEHRAVSNTPVLSETDEPEGLKKVVFAATKPLPSYLVALGVGPFDVVPAGTAGREPRADPDDRPEGPGGRRALGRGVHGAPPRPAREVLRHPVPVREARPAGHPAIPGRDGERRPRHVRVEPLLLARPRARPRAPALRLRGVVRPRDRRTSGSATS